MGAGASSGPKKSWANDIHEDYDATVSSGVVNLRSLPFKKHTLDEQLLWSSASLSVQALFWLVECGASVNHTDTQLTTPLHAACRSNSTTAVEFLLRCGAFPNAKDVFGWTPLHVACMLNRRDVIILLLQNNASIWIENSEGYTPDQVSTDTLLLENLLRYKLNNSRFQPNRSPNSFQWDEQLLQSRRFAVQSEECEDSYLIPRPAVFERPQIENVVRSLTASLSRFCLASSGKGLALLTAAGLVRDYPAEVASSLRDILPSVVKGRFACSFAWNESAVGQAFLDALPLKGRTAADVMRVAVMEAAPCGGVEHLTLWAERLALAWSRDEMENEKQQHEGRQQYAAITQLFGEDAGEGRRRAEVQRSQSVPFKRLRTNKVSHVAELLLAILLLMGAVRAKFISDHKGAEQPPCSANPGRRRTLLSSSQHRTSSSQPGNQYGGESPHHFDPPGEETPLHPTPPGPFPFDATVEGLSASLTSPLHAEVGDLAAMGSISFDDWIKGLALGLHTKSPINLKKLSEGADATGGNPLNHNIDDTISLFEFPKNELMDIYQETIQYALRAFSPSSASPAPPLSLLPPPHAISPHPLSLPTTPPPPEMSSSNVLLHEADGIPLYVPFRLVPARPANSSNSHRRLSLISVPSLLNDAAPPPPLRSSPSPSLETPPPRLSDQLHGAGAVPGVLLTSPPNSSAALARSFCESASIEAFGDVSSGLCRGFFTQKDAARLNGQVTVAHDEVLANSIVPCIPQGAQIPLYFNDLRSRLAVSYCSHPVLTLDLRLLEGGILLFIEMPPPQESLEPRPLAMTLVAGGWVNRVNSTVRIYGPPMRFSRRDATSHRRDSNARSSQLSFVNDPFHGHPVPAELYIQTKLNKGRSDKRRPGSSNRPLPRHSMSLCLPSPDGRWLEWTMDYITLTFETEKVAQNWELAFSKYCRHVNKK